MKNYYFLILLFFSYQLSAQEIKKQEYKKQITETNYEKGNSMVEVLPIIGFILSSNRSTIGNMMGFGHIIKYGYFLKNKSLLMIESEQNYYYYHNDKEGTFKESHTTSSTVDFSFRFYLLNKRFTPFIQAGVANIFNYDDWEDFDGLTPKAYYVASLNGGIGLSVPLFSKYNINFGYRYFYPFFYTKDANLYNRFIFTQGDHFFVGFSYIFNKNKKALKEKYSIE